MNKQELEKIQLELARKVKLLDDWKKLELIGGADLGYKKPVACLVILNKDMEIVEKVEMKHQVKFPYIPGFLAFREGPTILDCLENAENKPDILFVDGHGVAHPRGLGLASWVGLVSGIPTIGIAKSRLVGKYETPKDGEARPLLMNDKQVGWVFKPPGKRQIFISPGHLVSLESSLEITKKFILDHRMPEPLYLADKCTKSL